MSQSYYLVMDEEDTLEIYEFTSETECKMFIIYEINEWRSNNTSESDIDPELVEFYMKLSLEKLISKAKKYYSIGIEKCIIRKEIITNQ